MDCRHEWFGLNERVFQRVAHPGAQEGWVLRRAAWAALAVKYYARSGGGKTHSRTCSCFTACRRSFLISSISGFFSLSLREMSAVILAQRRRKHLEGQRDVHQFRPSWSAFSHLFTFVLKPLKGVNVGWKKELLSNNLQPRETSEKALCSRHRFHTVQ